MDRGAWRATVHGIANSRRLLKSGYAQHSTRDITEAQSIEYFKAVGALILCFRCRTIQFPRDVLDTNLGPFA